MLRLLATLGMATSCLLAQTSVRVPFVGCKSDGQAGPQPAPKGVAKIVNLDATAVKTLAFYKGEFDSGVLAPAGWYCFETYGSGGPRLFVTPQPLKTEALFSSNWLGFTGPAIQLSERSGDTSGRIEVARVIARVFPAHLAFARAVIQEGLPAEDFPSGPYPRDKLIYRSDSMVEYETPAHSEGLGTMSSLRANDHPISGVAILHGQPPDLVLLTLRLSPETSQLAPLIVRQTEFDNQSKK